MDISGVQVRSIVSGESHIDNGAPQGERLTPKDAESTEHEPSAGKQPQAKQQLIEKSEEANTSAPKTRGSARRVPETENVSYAPEPESGIAPELLKEVVKTELQTNPRAATTTKTASSQALKPDIEPTDSSPATKPLAKTGAQTAPKSLDAPTAVGSPASSPNPPKSQTPLVAATELKPVTDEKKRFFNRAETVKAPKRKRTLGTAKVSLVPPGKRKEPDVIEDLLAKHGAGSPTKEIKIEPVKPNQSPLTYNPELADRAVRAQNLLTDKRFLKMTRTLMRFSLEFAAEKVLPSKRQDDLETRKRNARRLREALVELGPTFIKLGQFLSVRRDCLTPEMADELALLQDKVPPFSFELVRKTLISELGAGPDQLFESFEEKPIASASIGQVHKAILKDGQKIVVKVQRPDLARRFYQDLGCMRLLAKWGVLLRPEGQWQDWIELSDEFGKNLFQEINYIQEGRNADRVRTMLKSEPGVKVPRIFWKLTGRRVLTLEYVPGIKIDKVKELEKNGFNLAKICNQLVDSYLDMVLMHGFFHADPHAGNLCVTPEGKIVIYDFGMMGEISDAQKEGITGCIASVIKRDTEELVHNLSVLGIVDKDAAPEPIMRTVQPFIDYYAGKPMLDLDFTDLEHDIDQIATNRALRLPATLAYLLRAGTSLEGIARTLQPNFSFVEAAKAPLKRWVMSRPHYAASLVKVFINGNLSIGQDAFLKLTPGKSQEIKATKDDKSRKFSKNSAATESAPQTAKAEEILELKARVSTLEKDLKERSRPGLVLPSVAVWLVFSTAASFVPEIRPYLNYFLIGNGVMGAIILWHLVRDLRLDNSHRYKGSSKGQRR